MIEILSYSPFCPDDLFLLIQLHQGSSDQMPFALDILQEFSFLLGHSQENLFFILQKLRQLRNTFQTVIYLVRHIRVHEHISGEQDAVIDSPSVTFFIGAFSLNIETFPVVFLGNDLLHHICKDILLPCHCLDHVPHNTLPSQRFVQQFGHQKLASRTVKIFAHKFPQRSADKPSVFTTNYLQTAVFRVCFAIPQYMTNTPDCHAQNITGTRLSHSTHYRLGSRSRYFDFNSSAIRDEQVRFMLA